MSAVSFTSCGRVSAPLALAAALALLWGCGARAPGGQAASSANPNQSVDLSATQMRFVTVAPVGERPFTIDHDTVGVVDFDQDHTVQVSPPYSGRILELRAKAGDHVRRGAVLFTIDSPDLVQAETTLISAAATLERTQQALERAKGLYAVQGMAQKDYEQAVADQRSAEGAFEAARDAVRIFGKSDAETDRIVTERHVDRSMPVASPIEGVVTARNAAPGALVQPGGSPAPYAVADVTTKWLLADVPEADVPALRLGQAVDVRVSALPNRRFAGRIDHIAEALNADTRRVSVRSEVPDQLDELRPQMFATFTLHLGAATSSVAVPAAAVVREGDGTMSVWVTTDQRHFVRRTVRLGEQQAGYQQVLEGLRAGEQVATSGALYISNASIVGAAQD